MVSYGFPLVSLWLTVNVNGGIVIPTGTDEGGEDWRSHRAVGGPHR